MDRETLFGVYIHIPFCNQICHYCDFTKYDIKKSLSLDEYARSTLNEIEERHAGVPYKKISTLYFGGGTPSLMTPEYLFRFIKKLKDLDFEFAPGAEWTIEIDPQTVDSPRLEELIDLGFNRFSVGVQTLNSDLLKKIGRTHSPEDAVDLVSLLSTKRLNFSVDLLFGLPKQSQEQLAFDIETLLKFSPPHFSPYCLTLGPKHPLNLNRPSDDEQTDMFRIIQNRLKEREIYQYEVSNFSKAGFESKHNLLYWTDDAYWGIGVSAHSYLPLNSISSLKWGLRFWNAPSINLYHRAHQGRSNSQFNLLKNLPENEHEVLLKNQYLTDFCHTSLRQKNGLSTDALRLRFGDQLVPVIEQRIQVCIDKGLVECSSGPKNSLKWSLSPEGIMLSNLVFESLTFLRDEILDI